MLTRGLFVVVVCLAACSRAGFRGAGGDGDSGGTAPTDLAGDRAVVTPTTTSRSFGGSADPSWTGARFSSTKTRDGIVYLSETAGFATKSAKLGAARAWASAARQQDALYLFGGGKQLASLAATQEIVAYRPGTDSISAVGSLPQPLLGSQAVPTPNGSIAVVMGIEATLNKNWETQVLGFDPIAGKVSFIVGGMYGAYHHAAALGVDGIVYAFGGYGSGPLKADIQGYDPVARKLLASTASLPSPREKHCAVASPDGAVYLFGGALVHAADPSQGGSITDQIVRFKPPSTVTVLAEKLPVPLINAACGLGSDGRIYVMGGDTPLPSGTATAPTSSVHRFDPLTGTLAAGVETLPAPLSGAACALGDNEKLYLFGGRLPGGLTTQILEHHPFAADGELLGPVIDTGAAGTLWLRLDGQPAAPAGTSLRILARAGDAPFLLDAGSPAWSPVEALPAASSLPSGRYLQWRVILATSNTAITPKLAALTVQYGSP